MNALMPFATHTEITNQQLLIPGIELKQKAA